MNLKVTNEQVVPFQKEIKRLCVILECIVVYELIIQQRQIANVHKERKFIIRCSDILLSLSVSHMIFLLEQPSSRTLPSPPFIEQDILLVFLQGFFVFC